MKIHIVIAAFATVAIVAPAFAQDALAAQTPASSEAPEAPASVRDTAKQLTGQVVMSLFDRLLKSKAQAVAQSEVATDQPETAEEQQDALEPKAPQRVARPPA